MPPAALKLTHAVFDRKGIGTRKQLVFFICSFICMLYLVNIVIPPKQAHSFYVLLYNYAFYSGDCGSRVHVVTGWGFLLYFFYKKVEKFAIIGKKAYTKN